MTKRVFEGVKRFQPQKAMGTHSRGRRRPDIAALMNSGPLNPVSAEILEEQKRLRSPSARKKSDFQKRFEEGLKAGRKPGKRKQKLAGQSLKKRNKKKKGRDKEKEKARAVSTEQGKKVQRPLPIIKRTPKKPRRKKSAVNSKQLGRVREIRVVGTVKQQFSHGRTKSVIVEKVIR